MKTKIEKILNDLYLIDPSFKKMEKDLKKIIEKVVADKPITELDSGFEDALRMQLLHKISDMKHREKFSFFNFLNSFFVKKFTFALAIILLLIVSPFVYNKFNSEPGMKIAYDEEIGLEDILASVSVFADIKNAYLPKNVLPEIEESDTNPLTAVNFEEMQKILGINFDEKQIEFLEENKFLLLDGFTDPESLIDTDNIYVNSDMILDSYDSFFDQYLMQLEEKNLYPLLLETISSLQQRAFEEFNNSQNIDAKVSLKRVAAYLTLGKVLLETKENSTNEFIKNLDKYKDNFDKDYFDKIKAEILLISDSSEIANSPLFGIYDLNSVNDYSQFRPRGHYDNSSDLRAYFRAMMLFGRQTFYFSSDEGVADSISLSYLLSDENIQKNWGKLADVTSFIAGNSDDITYSQFKTAISEALNRNFSDLTLDELFKNSNIELISNQTNKLPNPTISSEILIDNAKGLRLFGQAFTFDTYILNKLSQNPSAVFIPAVIAPDSIEDILPNRDENFHNKIMNLRKEFNELKPADWLSNISGAWLWTLSPLLQNYGEGYPAFMQNDIYATKNLQSALGAYTELKHDASLYSKSNTQVFNTSDETSDMMEKTSEKIKAFVEPDMEFWNRIIAMTIFTRDGLKSRELLDGEATKQFDTLLQSLYFYQNIASKELQNIEITKEEYENIRENFIKIEELIEGTNSMEKTPIASIHTDLDTEEILYEALGNPFIIIAFVSNQDSPRLVIGMAFRHFEFTEDLNYKRLNDEDWEKRLDGNDLPEMPFYYKSLFEYK